MEKYKSSDKIVTLKCDERHYFHDKCLENNIEAGNFVCPMCKEPIACDNC